ncbi:MAG: hypothetical protein EOO52_09085 [Gammaproteobacteria bacterium]|nr:MAG: hypothetical protein EOO52_09085 [Gammaproteobacteria bacterium]
MKSFLNIYFLLLLLSFPVQAKSAKQEQLVLTSLSKPPKLIEFNAPQLFFFLLDEISEYIYELTGADVSIYQILSFVLLTSIFYLTIN